MIAKITYTDKTEFVQIRGFQRFVEDDGEISYLIDIDGEIEYELTPYELLINDDSLVYKSIEFLTDSMAIMDTLIYNGEN